MPSRDDNASDLQSFQTDPGEKMNNRIARYWSSFDSLVGASSQRAADEVKRLESSPYSATNPLEVFLDREYLRSVIEVSIKQMSSHAKGLADNPEVREQLRWEIKKRRAFLKWMDSDEASTLYVGIFPAAEFSTPATVEDDSSS